MGVSSLTQEVGVLTWLVVMLISTLLVASQVRAPNPVPILYLLIDTFALADLTRVPTLGLLFETFALVDMRFVALTVTPLSSPVGLLLSCTCWLSCLRLSRCLHL